jgi:hypothetical protein
MSTPQIDERDAWLWRTSPDESPARAAACTQYSEDDDEVRRAADIDQVLREQPVATRKAREIRFCVENEVTCAAAICRVAVSSGLTSFDLSRRCLSAAASAPCREDSVTHT